jgi:hypothetical protein
MVRELMFAAILATAAAGAVADESRGFTFGVGVAETYYDLNPSATGGVTGKDHATGWEAFAGYRVNRYVAVEATYFDGGELRESIPGMDLKLTAKGYGGSVIGTLPVGESFGFFARAGYIAGEIKLRASSLFGTSVVKSDDDTVIVGAGVMATMDTVHVRLEYGQADFDLLDAGRVSLNLAWLF